MAEEEERKPSFPEEFDAEFGIWTEDGALVERAEQFLVTAMRFFEGLDPETDWFEPELAPVEYDDEAFREVLAEMQWDEGRR